MNKEIRGTTETRTWTSTRRYNGKCKACKRAHSILRTFDCTESRSTVKIERPYRTERETTPVNARGVACCGRAVKMLPVKGTKRPEIACGAKCLNGTGHVCECACGGRNHGAGNSSIIELA
jgi:hypothetical protein